MNYEEFKAALKKMIDERLSELQGTELTEEKVTKNNGVKKDALILKKEGRTCTPVVYVQDFYDMYLRGGTIDALADEAFACLSSHRAPLTHFDINRIFDFDSVKDSIIMRLVNYEKNQELLKDCPFIRKLDLAITFRILLENDDHTSASVLLTDHILKSWPISGEELSGIASANMNRLLPAVLRPISDYVEVDCEVKLPELFVLTNTSGNDGAAMLFSTDALRDFACSLHKNIFILPSSVHELLLLPEEGTEEISCLGEIVREVNREALQDVDFLSDHVYRYIYEEDRLEIAV